MRADMSSVVFEPSPAQLPCSLLQMVPPKAELGLPPMMLPRASHMAAQGSCTCDGGTGRCGISKCMGWSEVAVPLPWRCAETRQVCGNAYSELGGGLPQACQDFINLLAALLIH